jgi:cytochrome c oxidase subunit III
MAAGAATHEMHYYVPSPSKWPMFGSLSLLIMGFGAGLTVNQMPAGYYMLAAGFALLIFTLVGWFSVVASESEGRKYGANVDLSFRWGMGWFIFSEVMFFGAFFGALWYARTITMPWLGDLDHKMVLWPDFSASWPNIGPAGTIEAYQRMGPFWIPTINTALLLISGVTLTIAHHALLANKRGPLQVWLLMTILLGAVFMGFQVYEYIHAYSDLNLKLTSGIFGSTFFMLTGFHGFHVTIGAIMLAVILFRISKGHFSAEHHFGFEGAAWYWHFVDVVWLGLYVIVYWL